MYIANGFDARKILDIPIVIPVLDPILFFIKVVILKITENDFLGFETFYNRSMVIPRFPCRNPPEGLRVCNDEEGP